jgi:hypothetical protein
MRVPLSRPVTVEEGEEQTHMRAGAWPAWHLAEPSWRASALYRAGFSTSSMRYPSRFGVEMARNTALGLTPYAAATPAGTTSANLTVSMNCRKRASLPSRISQTWTTGTSSVLPVALPVPV